MYDFSKPLYCYRLNETTQQLECYVIKEYEVKYDTIGYANALVGLKDMGLQYCKVSNINRYIRGSLVMFAQDNDKAHDIIQQSLEEQIQVAEKRLNKLKNAYSLLN